MSTRARLLSVTGLALLMAGIVVLVWAGLRSRPSSAQLFSAPLIAPRFSRLPQLKLGVLGSGEIPPSLRVTWASARSEGDVVALPALRGHPVVVNFWASWCDPCRREAPILERAWRRNGSEVLFLGVNENDARNDALSFVTRFGITYPSLRESGLATATRWGARGFPVTFFIARDGRAVAQTIGQLRAGQLERGIRAARRGRL